MAVERSDLIRREDAKAAIRQKFADLADRCEINEVLNGLPAVDAASLITGETSDGYHTFNELYHHRAVLFSVIVRNYPERAWKAKRHADGTMYDGMFIVGIDTPDGQATYHYDIDPYWDMFNCRVLDNAPEWDGHTSAQDIERIGKLPAVDAVEAIPVEWLENLMNECAESDVGLNNDIFRVLTKWTREQMDGGEHDEAD